MIDYNTKTRGHVLLETYLQKRRISAKDFAEELGVAQMRISHLLSKNIRRRASFDLAGQIEDATGGIVKMRSWLEPVKD